MSTKLIRQAIQQSTKSMHSKHHHGAIITCGGKVLYRGSNKNDYYCHAELDVILKLCKLRPFMQTT